jgi:hypothetical protein
MFAVYFVFLGSNSCQFSLTCLGPGSRQSTTVPASTNQTLGPKMERAEKGESCQN